MGTDKLQRRNWLAVQLPIAVLIGALGCGGTPTPLSPDSSTPAPTTGYRVSGVVTDDHGATLPNAVVVLDHGPRLPDLNAATQRVTVRTGVDGSYSLFLRPEQVQVGHTPFAIIQAYTLTSRLPGDHFSYAQVLDGQGTSAVKNIRLRRTRTIYAGQGSMTIGFDSDSSLCAFAGVSVTTLCEWFVVRSSTAGTVIVEARPEGGGMVPTLRSWNDVGQGTISSSIDADEDLPYVEVAIAIPVGTASQRYNVVATLK